MDHGTKAHMSCGSLRVCGLWLDSLCMMWLSSALVIEGVGETTVVDVVLSALWLRCVVEWCNPN